MPFPKVTINQYEYTVDAKELEEGGQIGRVELGKEGVYPILKIFDLGVKKELVKINIE